MTLKRVATVFFAVVVPEWLRRLRFIWKLAALSFVFCTLTLAVMLLAGAKDANAQHGGGGGHLPTPRGQQQQPDQSGTSTAARTTAGIAAQANGGVIYAPRDVVDMSRLVLEVSRDNTAHLAHYIELGTTVIVV